MIVRMFVVSAVALAIGAYVEQARAGQFFVCEDGQTVEVEFSQLEETKRTNACVAKYFGIKLNKSTMPVQAKSGLQRDAGSPTMARPVLLPVRKPLIPKLRAGVATTTATSGNSRRLAGAAVNALRVQIINAQPGSKKWFDQKN